MNDQSDRGGGGGGEESGAPTGTKPGRHVSISRPIHAAASKRFPHNHNLISFTHLIEDLAGFTFRKHQFNSVAANPAATFEGGGVGWA